VTGREEAHFGQPFEDPIRVCEKTGVAIGSVLRIEPWL
jgi:hypothetical protein